MTALPPGARPVDPDAEVRRLSDERTPPSPEEQCVQRGGHCYEDTGLVLTSIPPQYPQVCKHCGKSRIATPREPFEYRDA